MVNKKARKTFEGKLKLLYERVDRLGKSSFYKVRDMNNKTYAIYYNGGEAIKSLECGDVEVESDNKDILKLYNVEGFISVANVKINPIIFNDGNSCALARVYEGKFIYTQGLENDTNIIKADNYKKINSNLYMLSRNDGDDSFFKYLRLIDTKHGKFDEIFKIYGDTSVLEFKSLWEDSMYCIYATGNNGGYILLYRNRDTFKIDIAYRYREVIQINDKPYFLGIKNMQGEMNIGKLGKYRYDILDIRGLVVSNIEAYRVNGYCKKKHQDFYKYVSFQENNSVYEEKIRVINLENNCEEKIMAEDEIKEIENITKPFSTYIIHE